MILETKLQPPSLKPNTLKRERLLKLLKNNLERKLVLVTGDAGYGKTTLLAQVIEEANLPCVFYDLDKGDSDLVVFCSYLVHGLEKVQKGLASRTKGLLEQGGEVGKNYELLFGTLINELVEKRKEELFFILDDYHALPEDSLVHKALDYFIDHLPDIVHVMISSRTMPPLLSLAKWRAKQDLFELTREGLRFTEEEVRSLLTEVYKLVLSEEELKRVSEQTEGWITGIQLILQSAGKDGKTVKETLNGYLEANRPLFEYFANEVLRGEDVEVQRFLVETSIFETVTPEACEKVLGRPDAKRLLADLEKRHLFLSVVGEGQYRYHHLFREYLKTRLEESAKLHLKAADYYQRTGQWERAIEHYLDVGSYEWAARILETEARQLGEKGEYGTLQRLFARIPREEITKRPKLLLCQSGLLSWVGDPEGALSLAEQAEGAYRSMRSHQEADEAAFKAANAELILGRLRKAQSRLEKVIENQTAQGDELLVNAQNVLGVIYIHQGRYRKALQVWRQALAVAEREKLFVLVAMIGSNLGAKEAEHGERRSAVESFLRALVALQAYPHPAAGTICFNLAVCEIEDGRFTEAEEHLCEGLRVARRYGDVITQIRLLLGVVRLQRERGHLNEAGAALEEARVLWERSGRRPIVAELLHREEAFLSAAREDWKATQEKIVRLFETDKGKHPDALFLLGWVYFKLGNFLAAEKTWLEVLKDGEKKKHLYVIARSYLYLAFLREHEGRRKEALRYLRVALPMARKWRYDYFLRKQGEKWFPLWKLALQEKIEPDMLTPIMEELQPDTQELPACDLGVRILGPVEVFHQKSLIGMNWYSRKARSLFCYLVLHRKGPVKSEELMEEFWPKAKPELASHNLRQTVFSLRKELSRVAGCKGEAVLVHEVDGYRLSPDMEVWLDSEAFAGLVSEGFRLMQNEPEKALSLFQQAKALWRGEPLFGLEEGWCEGGRQDLKSRFLSLNFEMGRIYFCQGNFYEALACFREAVQADPYAESGHQGIMKSLGKLGKHKELEEHYHALVTRLWKDLEVEPMPETKKVYEEILEKGA